MKIIFLLIVVLFLCPTMGTFTRLDNVGTTQSLEAFGIYNGVIYVVWSEIISGHWYWDAGTWKPEHKRVWVEIYKANGRYIILYKTIEVKIIPARAEGWEFDKKLLEE